MIMDRLMSNSIYRPYSMLIHQADTQKNKQKTQNRTTLCGKQTMSPPPTLAEVSPQMRHAD